MNKIYITQPAWIIAVQFVFITIVIAVLSFAAIQNRNIIIENNKRDVEQQRLIMENSELIKENSRLIKEHLK